MAYQLNQTTPPGYVLFFKANQPNPEQYVQGGPFYMSYFDLTLNASLRQIVGPNGEDLEQPFEFSILEMIPPTTVEEYAPNYFDRDFVLVPIYDPEKDPDPDSTQTTGFLELDEEGKPKATKVGSIEKVVELNNTGQIALPSQTVKTLEKTVPDGIIQDKPGTGETGSIIDWGVDDPFHIANTKTYFSTNIMKWVYLAGFVYSVTQLTKKDTNKILWGSASAYTGYKTYKFFKR